MKIWILFILVSLFPFQLSLANEPQLDFKFEKETIRYTRSQLLNHPAKTQITVKNDPAYPGKVMVYEAVAVHQLVDSTKINPDAVIQFKALDGFSAPISKERLFNSSQSKSIAYLAVENPKKPWPKFNSTQNSVGPFYLIWKNPEKSKIAQEEWPFMLASFEEKGSLRKLYPKIFPKGKIDSKNSVQLGFEVFRKNCFACHTLNKQGSSNLGPDLNLPMNPTEYFSDAHLKKLIRNGQDIRYFPQSKMSRFDKNALSDTELNHLIDYLKYMAKNR